MNPDLVYICALPSVRLKYMSTVGPRLSFRSRNPHHQQVSTNAHRTAQTTNVTLHRGAGQHKTRGCKLVGQWGLTCNSPRKVPHQGKRPSPRLQTLSAFRTYIFPSADFSRGNEIWIACNLDYAKELQTHQLDKLTAEVQRHTHSETLFATLAQIPLIFTMGVTLFGRYNDSELFASVDDRNGYDDSSPKQAAEIPVLIVGGGPAGLLQAYLLSRLGVRSLVVERYPKRLGAPKAHALSPRSLEICRQFGLDMGHIRSLGTPRDDARWVNFQTTLSGIPLGRLPYERMDPAVLDSTPEMILNIPQPDFEQYLSEELSKQSVAEIWKGISFVSLEEHEDTVTTLLEERDTGKLYKVRSKFVIACDGAKSKVREVIGTKTDGEDSCKHIAHLLVPCDQANIW